MGTDADVWARTQTYMHERTRMGTDADIHACTGTDADGFKRTDAHARERTHTGARRTYIIHNELWLHNTVQGGREKNTRYVAG